MAVNRGNLFSAVSLSEYMISSLPEEPSPQLQNPYDAIALLTNACMLAVGFRLVGLGEGHKIAASGDINKAERLPQEWNASSPNHAFRYAHDQSSMEYLVKTSRLGSKAVINGLGIGDERVHTIDLAIQDFISEASFPFSLSSEPSEDADKLRHLFISAGRMSDAGTLLKLQIIQKLVPGLRKEGYEESAHAASQAAEQTRHEESRTPRPGDAQPGSVHDPLRDDRLPQPARPHPFNDPLAAEPRRPFPQGDFPPPGFDDEYDLNRPPRGGLTGGGRPLNIGERDLYPPGLGPNDPFHGGGGFGQGGGGMHPMMDDPLFGGRAGSGRVDPRAPPGARYDPIGPGDGPPNASGRFPGSRGMGGGPPNPFGGFGSGDFI